MCFTWEWEWQYGNILLSFDFEYLIRMGEDSRNMLTKAHSRPAEKPLWIDWGRWHRYVSVTSKSNSDSDVQPMAPVPPSYEEATAGGSPCYSGAYTGDGEMLTEFSWDDQNIRRIFIRKVYSILMIQLSVTIAFVALFVFCEPVKYYIQTNPGWYWASYGVFFVTYLTLSCCRGPRRQFPWNLILLIIFTLSLSYMTGMLSSYYNTKSVIICLGITALVCLAITIFSFQTKIDITSYQGVLLVFCTVLFICGLVLAFTLPFGYVPWLHAVYAVLGAILFCMFLAFDTQMLMGKKQYTISPEEYIFATLSLYLDIVYIFSFILQLFGTPNRE
ncbi:protein lifeguard 2-like isoform X1 [Carassius carassius]|uniref:protein lifeguard 2-like isoform X1 n=1 Tax=Carassius carassius TaxID=217509 RepID=UPI00286938F4|nr:protein lifeguard 2-like isoform X1 [Carassius carassius]